MELEQGKTEVSLICCLQASQPDELTIEEQEILEVIDDGDMEDWLKVRCCYTFMYVYIESLCTPFSSRMFKGGKNNGCISAQ